MIEVNPFMTFYFTIGIIAIVLAVINLIVLLYGLIKKKMLPIEALIIVVASIVIPYGLALLYAKFIGNGDIGEGLITWIVSGLILMLLVSVYLYSKIKNEQI